ncbi:hypothetical protein B0H14DRAFT_2570099 [Mycena olivaceomarginata]|nr:hypothetical protein B0H14DRAFT_2570099 [Mycena olivaceomarginata]
MCRVVNNVKVYYPHTAAHEPLLNEHAGLWQLCKLFLELLEPRGDKFIKQAGLRVELYDCEVDIAARSNAFITSLAKPAYLGLPLPRVGRERQRYGIEPRVHDVMWDFVRAEDFFNESDVPFPILRDGGRWAKPGTEGRPVVASTPVDPTVEPTGSDNQGVVLPSPSPEPTGPKSPIPPDDQGNVLVASTPDHVVAPAKAKQRPRPRPLVQVPKRKRSTHDADDAAPPLTRQRLELAGSDQEEADCPDANADPDDMLIDPNPEPESNDNGDDNSGTTVPKKTAAKKTAAKKTCACKGLVALSVLFVSKTTINYYSDLKLLLELYNVSQPGKIRKSTKMDYIFYYIPCAANISFFVFFFFFSSRRLKLMIPNAVSRSHEYISTTTVMNWTNENNALWIVKATEAESPKD